MTFHFGVVNKIFNSSMAKVFFTSKLVCLVLMNILWFSRVPVVVYFIIIKYLDQKLEFQDLYRLKVYEAKWNPMESFFISL